MVPRAEPDWRLLAQEPPQRRSIIDPKRRLRMAMGLFAAAMLIVFGRVIQLQWAQGEAFRHFAAQPIVRRQAIDGIRGRILTRDGTVLAEDQQRPALAIHYRQLEEPPNRQWLRRQARAALSPSQRRDERRVAAEEAWLVAQRQLMHERLAAMCGLTRQQWTERTRRIQQRVERIAQRVNERRRSARSHRDPQHGGQSFWQRVCAHLEQLMEADELHDEPIVVAEEMDYHVVVEEVSLDVVAEVEGNPRQYPYVRIEPRRRRHYPHGSLAAHIVGHLGPADSQGQAASESVGRMGLEQTYEAVLRSRPGRLVEHLHRTGDVVWSHREREPQSGRDLTLTLDLALQRAAESLLDSACQRRDALSEKPLPAGGAIVVLDVHSGAVLAMASAPRFDPNWFIAAGLPAAGEELSHVLSDAAHPLFDRPLRMALPPGSVFKPFVAAAMLEAAEMDPNATMHCRGYLHHPDALRCQIYTRTGMGHGDVTLARALAVSCNVYFFHAASAMGSQPLVEWANRFGFGRATGIDLPAESAGHVPLPDSAWRVADTQALAIGQSRLTATPLQLARAMAALANGGYLVQPHVVNSVGSTTAVLGVANDVLPSEEPRRIEGLTLDTLEAIREGMQRVVADVEGTAHETAFLENLPLCGKTGTAQAGGELPDHAWFAGFCPADEPKVALVAVLEHGGEGGQAAAPIVRRLVERMIQLGYFQRYLRQAAAE